MIIIIKIQKEFGHICFLSIILAKYLFFVKLCFILCKKTSHDETHFKIQWQKLFQLLRRKMNFWHIER